MLLLTIILLGGGLVVSVRSECTNGMNIHSILNDFDTNSPTICIDTSNFIYKIVPFHCCVFDSNTCLITKTIYEYYYKEYYKSKTEFNKCYHNVFRSFYLLCNCGKVTPPHPTTEKCGISDQHPLFYAAISPYIAGGSLAKACEFPWMVFYEDENYVCGGTLIDSRHVVTAAHCAVNKNVNDMYVYLNTTDRWRPPIRVHVKHVLIHPSYIRNMSSIFNDIAILTLDKEVKYSPCIRPICLPEQSNPVTNRDYCFISGWGTRGEVGTTQRLLYKARVPLQSNAVCRSTIVTFNEGQICAGYLQGGTDTCGGDSGGPLICPSNNHWILVGIVSYGQGCARPYSPGVYTDVRHYMNWIKSNIN